MNSNNYHNWDGLTTQRYFRRDWHYCPYCNAKAVSKQMKQCNACHKRLFWLGDEAGINRAISRRDPFHIWCKPVGNQIEGWYPLSWFLGACAYGPTKY